MYVNKNFNLKGVLRFTGGHIIWLTLWATSTALIWEYAELHWLTIPWLPLSVIGLAVAFYIGFKNNSAYDRLWEARKIWGGIVNDSRTWASSVRSYVSNQFLAHTKSPEELAAHHRRLIYRHIGWLYTLRKQLLIPTSWEHVNQNRFVRKVNEKRMEQFGGVNQNKEGVTKEALKDFVGPEELERLLKAKNTATQLIDQQSQDLQNLRTHNLIDDFRHVELQKLLREFYALQGKCERLKKFPLPRQYGSMSFYFVAIFIFLLPFGMISEFAKLGDFGIWMSIPFTILIGWVFLMMELIGDYSENPFEGLGNDIPMMSLCRTIEIDLREMLGETELPAPIEPINGVLM